ncbi:hypothetical protein ITJ38_13330 [Agreia pratensis]|uniref:Uncharacterized protein n=1 Tax=Agreia pratensis TaxID=150121 RepID=A0A1X7JSI7_9MICO|nr:DUF6121 family protein [Agreia pratensis]MBF4635391.1 hypothetical protein [Agreia pratensis]SMG30542.1 hypothetical protein SAMN06296010_1698 [Agreia pratensis]
MPSRGLRYGRSVFATALFVALVVAGWGFVSLLAETEVVADPDVGPIVAPVSVAVSAVAVLFALASPRWSTVTGRGLGAVLGSSAVLALGAVAVQLATLGLLQFVATGRLTALLLVIAAQAPTPFTIVVVGAAFVSAIGLSLIGAGQGGASWPWEKDDE